MGKFIELTVKPNISDREIGRVLIDIDSISYIEEYISNYKPNPDTGITIKDKTIVHFITGAESIKVEEPYEYVASLIHKQE